MTNTLVRWGFSTSPMIKSWSSPIGILASLVFDSYLSVIFASLTYSCYHIYIYRGHIK